MKILLTVLLVFSIVVLGYATHVDAQTKKQQELLKIVNDAEHSLTKIQHNPNYIKHSHLTAYEQNQ
ncbi:MAG TPA: hypothetical protein PLS76_10290 [Acinetobacter sp.]|nr:hypothetical protein [Acinetobacter sp.]